MKRKLKMKMKRKRNSNMPTMVKNNRSAELNNEPSEPSKPSTCLMTD